MNHTCLGLLTASIPLLMSPLLAAADIPRKEAKPDPKPSTAWGKPTGGLQAGIREWTSGKNPGPGGLEMGRDARAQVELEILIRNVGKAPIMFEYRPMVFWGESEDGVVTAQGKHVYGGLITQEMRFQVKLAPGKEHVLAALPIYMPGSENGLFGKLTALKPGGYHIGTDRIELEIAGVKGLQLGTGYLDLHIPETEK